MRAVKGFALLLALLLVFLLTVFACAMLLLAQDHYGSSKMLHDSENARSVCESVAHRLVRQHNFETPRYFLDPLAWDGLQMKPLVWNGYGIQGSLSEPWNSTNVNLLRFKVQRARSFASLELPLEQIRLEHFALFSDAQLTLSTSTLFDGLVYVRNGMTLNQRTRFREPVHAEVSPEYYASYRMPAMEKFDFRGLSTTGILPDGFKITGRDPRFWKGTHYELDLDQITLTPQESSWRVRYRGTLLGETSTLVFTFDDAVHVSQSYTAIPHLPSGKLQTPVYIRSSMDVVIESSIQSLQQTHEHPLLLEAANTVRLAPRQTAIRIEAVLIGRGEVSMQITSGPEAITPAEQEWWKSEIHGSVFVMEPEKREELMEALATGQKVVWFRGSVGVQGSILTSTDIASIHFQASLKSYSLLTSFPFVRIVEGRQRWL